AEQTAATEKAQLEGTIAQLRADRAATDAKAGWRQKASLGPIAGLRGGVTGSAFGFLTSRRQASVAHQPAAQPGAERVGGAAKSRNGTQPIELSALSQNRAQAIDLPALSQNGTQPFELPAQSQNGAQEIVPHVASPEIVGAEAAVGLALGVQVEPAPTSAPAPVSASAGEKLNGGGEALAPRPS